MATPPPAVLQACAEQLRSLASTQRNHANACDGLLDTISALANDQTWTGPYAVATNNQIAGWVKTLAATAAQMRADAASWEASANGFDEQAKSPANAAAH